MNVLQILIITILSFLGLFFFIKDTLIFKIVGCYGSFILLIESLYMLMVFDKSIVGYQMESFFVMSNKLNLIYYIGIDGVSIFFIILSIFLLPLCLLCSWTTITYHIKEFYILLYIIIFLLIQVFTVIDICLFYIFFESILIPMFLIIGIWGSRERKVHAGYQFFLYTVIGSILMLLAIIYIYIKVGSTNLYVLLDNNNNTFEIIEKKLLWFAFFISFAVKTPLIPVHIWLPEAHVEAPTAGSVLLAGILLKMGTYGFLRFLIPLFPDILLYFQPFVCLLCIIGIIYTACTTIRQVDLKKIIAYSSISHMSFVILGLISNNIYGIEGSVFLMISHGLVSSALFMCVGLLYERYHTRIILYYGSLVYGMPVFSIYLLLFILANMSLPGTSSFIGEFLILLSLYKISFIILFLAASGVILGAIYSIWLYNRVIFGVIKINNIKIFSDLNVKENYLMFFLFSNILYLGIYPTCLLENMHMSTLFLFENQM